jgi:5'-nucleotidase
MNVLFAILALSAPSTPIEISIVGTSDLHGRIDKLPLLGGYLQNLRTARPARVLLVDAGDMYQGSLESDPNEGDAAIRAYGLLGYQAVAVGNHDLDFGPEGPHATPQAPSEDPRGALKARAAQAQFPFLAANMAEDGAPLAWPNVKPTALIALGEGKQKLKVGVVGVTSMATPQMTIAANFHGLSMLPMLEVVVAQAKRLRAEGAEIVVVVAHAGGRCEKLSDPKDLSSCDRKAEIFQLAEALPKGSVDAIVGGHVHAGIAQEVNGIPIIEAFAQGQSFGRIDLAWDQKQKRVTQSKIFPPERLKDGASYEGKAVLPVQAVAEAVAPALAAAKERRAAVLGTELGEAFARSYSAESPLGNLVSSLMLALEPRAEIALTNGGGLRADLPAGPLHYGALYDALPFDNRMALVGITGGALKKYLQKNLGGSGGVISIAGAHISARCEGDALVVDVTRDSGKPIADGEEILVATSDFLATGGEGFTARQQGDVSGGPVIREAIADYFRQSQAPLRVEDVFSKDAPRLHLPSARPVACQPKTAQR